MTFNNTYWTTTTNNRPVFDANALYEAVFRLRAEGANPTHFWIHPHQAEEMRQWLEQSARPSSKTHGRRI